MRGAFLALLAILLTGTPAMAGETPEFYEQVYLTRPQALEVALPAHDAIRERAFKPAPELRKRLERRLGRHLEEPDYTFFEGVFKGRPVGYALILDETGKYHPITFVVGLTPGGEVRDVAVMVYREKRGEAVRRHRFLGQFEGKTVADPLMVNRDIVHLTGATVSSWAIAAGVKKALVLFEAFEKASP